MSSSLVLKATLNSSVSLTSHLLAVPGTSSRTEQPPPLQKPWQCQGWSSRASQCDVQMRCLARLSSMTTEANEVPGSFFRWGKMWQLSLLYSAWYTCSASREACINYLYSNFGKEQTSRQSAAWWQPWAKEEKLSVQSAVTVGQTSLTSSKEKPELWTRFVGRSICWLHECKFLCCIHWQQCPLISWMWIFCHGTWCNLWKLSCAYFSVNHFVLCVCVGVFVPFDSLSCSLYDFRQPMLSITESL